MKSNLCNVLLVKCINRSKKDALWTEIDKLIRDKLPTGQQSRYLSFGEGYELLLLLFLDSTIFAMKAGSIYIYIYS